MNLKMKKANHDFTSLVEMLQTRSAKDPDRIIYRFLNYYENDRIIENEITYSGLDRNARCIAQWFQERGAAGERALLLYPPGLDYISAFFGCLYSGVIAVPAYPPLSPKLIPRIESIVSNAGAKFIMTISPIMNLIRSKMDAKSNLHSMEWFTTDTVDSGSWADYRDIRIPGDSTAFLQYTSGSTSSPKGVVLTHDNLLHNEHIIKNSFECNTDSVCVIWLPPYHDMGLIGGILQPVYADFPCNLLSPMDFLQKPVRWLQAITKYRGTVSGGPNFAYELCNRKVTDHELEALDLSSWDLAFNGAEPIRVEVIDEFVKKFSPSGFSDRAIYPCYGLAESTLIVSGGRKYDPPVVEKFDRTSIENNSAVTSDDGAMVLVGCGRALEDGTIMIVDPDTFDECNEQTVGEIWISGPSVAEGYWRLDRSESGRIFNAFTKNFGGPFLRTGDLGFLKKGELFVTGRLKDMIIIRGRNYYPHDIEYTVERSHSALRNGCCAAFSVDHEGDEKLVVVQEIKSGLDENFNAEEVLAAISRSVSEQHELSVFSTVLIRSGSIPKTSSGKIQRWACRKGYLENTLASVTGNREKIEPASLQTDTSERQTMSGMNVTPDFIRSWLVNKIAERVKLPSNRIDIHSTFSSFGLVSVDIVNITGELETLLKRRISPATIYNYPTIDTFAKFVFSGNDDAAHYSRKDTESAEPVAVIGIGCRFPGGADTPDRFYRMLRDGVDAVTEIPEQRRISSGEDSWINTIRSGGFLESIDMFDPVFFGISPKEAASIDPQQRLLVEVTWEAFEDAGITSRMRSGRKTGVFVGISNNDYGRIPGENSQGLFEGTGNALSIAANRLSYLFDLNGPSIAVDTACSSSLVAVHLAVNSIRNGESDIAIAGGVNLILTDDLTRILSDAKMLSPDGLCKTFDSEANGYVRGEGCGVVILKRLSDAIRDRDRIQGVIRGSAVNQDGRSNGLTAPNGLSQESVIKQALDNAGVNPSDIDYLEAHGTGTPLGDPIEVNSIINVLKNGREGSSCRIGSVKTNIGHLESAAGIAGLIKTVLCLKNREFVPSLHMKKINPHIVMDGDQFVINTGLLPWPAATGRARLAGVSSFGMGGTNSHIILQEPPEEENPLITKNTPAQQPSHDILCISAVRDSDLRNISSSWQNFLTDNPRHHLHDICMTANSRREHFSSRAVIVCRSADSLIEKLSAYSSGDISSGIYESRIASDGSHPKTAFMFTGQGSQYSGMGRELYDTHPVFREHIVECHNILFDRFKIPLLDLLYGDNDTGAINNTAIAQPALFALEYSLARLWISWGIVPDAVIGHSIGEYTAACIAGIFSVEDALMLTAARGKLMSLLPVDGGMISVLIPENEAREIIAPFRDLSIAAVNTENSVVISGLKDSLEAAAGVISKRGLTYRRLNVSRPFHSPAMEGMLGDFSSILRRAEYRTPTIPLVSNITGEFITGSACDEKYWLDHITKPVRFSDGIGFLKNNGYNLFIETGPGEVLSGYARRIIRDSGSLIVNSLPGTSGERDRNSDWQTMLTALGKVYVNGADIDWESFYLPFRRKIISAPGYSFDRLRYWKAQVTGRKDNTGHRAASNSTPPVAVNSILDNRSGSIIANELVSVMKEHAAIIRDQTRLFGSYLGLSDTALPQGISPAGTVNSVTENTPIKKNTSKKENSNLHDRIVEIVAEISAYPPSQIDDNMRFLDNLGFDSLMITGLMNRIIIDYPEYSERSKDIIRFIITSNASIAALLKLLAGISSADGNGSTVNESEISGTLESLTPIQNRNSETAADVISEKQTIPDEEIPEENYRLDLMPGYVELKSFRERNSSYNPYSRVNQGMALDTVKIDGRELINFATFGYLGLNGSPEISAAVNDAMSRYGTSVSGSRLLSGEIPLHGELEKEIATALGTEDAVAYTGGHTTNVATIGYLFGPGDLILHDSLAHNSLIQGSLLSGAARRPFPHNNWEALDAILAKVRRHYRRVLIAIEGVYSMDGDIPCLPEFIRVKNRHRAFLMIDEAHSFGVLGKTGMGITEHFGADPADVDILMGTLSKAIPSCGGYISGKRALTDNLRHSAPGFIFSTGISPSNTAAALESIRLIRSRPELVQRLQRNGELFLKLAKEHGLNTGTSSSTPVVPVITGNSGVCIELSKALYGKGINVMPIIYPAVDENKARLRFFLSALHTEEQITNTVSAVAEEIQRLHKL